MDMDIIIIHLLTRKYLLICLLVLQLISVSVTTSNTFNIVGLFPITSNNKESGDLRWATTNLTQEYLGQNASIDIKVYNDSDKPGMAMKAMLEIFAQQNNHTAIIGPGDTKAIRNLDLFLNMIPEKVLHLVYNPVINSRDYLHNSAPPVSLVVDLLVDLMVKIKWNYIGVMRDSTEFSVSSYNLFKEKARERQICIGVVEVMNKEPIFKRIKDEFIRGILVFGSEDTVRSISRNVKKAKNLKNSNFRFIFASNENLNSENAKTDLLDYSMQVLWNGFYNQGTSKDHLKYIIDSVRMALSWFKVCQNVSECMDLKRQEIYSGTLDIYQKVEGRQLKVGTYEKELNLNLADIKTEKSYCVKTCEKCRLLNTVENPYIIKQGTPYVVLLLPLHKNDVNDPFKCSTSFHFTESVDLIEAARFAIKTSINPRLGLIIVDSCVQALVATEYLIEVDYTNVLGVVGGYYSLTTIPAAEILTRLQIPHISYAAGSHVLADRDRFPYFQRTAISLEEITEAIILLCKRMEWKAINVIYNNEAYGISGHSLLLKYAEIHGICIVNDIKVELADKKFHTYLNQLRKTSKVKIVVNFLLSQSQAEWSVVLNEDLEDKEFLFIRSEIDTEVPKMLKKHFNNQVFMKNNKPTNQDFIDYFTNLKRSDIETNPWAKDFIEEKYRCRFEGSFNTAFTEECKYQLKTDSVSTYHDLLIKAIYALINGTLQADKDNSGSKDDKAERISREIRKTTFNISGKEQRLFDDDGNSQIQLFSLQRVIKVDPFIQYDEIATFKDGTWESGRWDEFSSFMSTCESDDSCTVCPEENKTGYIVFTVFTVLDVVLALAVIIIIGIFIWKKKNVS